MRYTSYCKCKNVLEGQDKNRVSNHRLYCTSEILVKIWHHNKYLNITVKNPIILNFSEKITEYILQPI